MGNRLSLSVEYRAHGGERKKRAGRASPEADLQEAILSFWRLAAPRDAVLFHVPNGGSRHVLEAIRFKALGVAAGIPDLILAHAGAGYGIELKASGAGLSVEQRAMHARLNDAGWRVAVVRSLEEFWWFCLDIGLRVRMSEEELAWHMRKVPAARAAAQRRPGGRR